MAVSIEPMIVPDWPAVRAIYAAGLETGHASFETMVPDWEQWDAFHLEDPRLVAREEDEIIGWAALTPASRRPVYRGVAEVSVYVDPPRHGEGIGTNLLGALVEASERAGLWTLQASIFPENEASIALHRRFGFREVGIRVRVARHHDRWRDVVLMERRSDVVGVGGGD